MRDAVQHAGDVVDARHGLLVEADDHVARLQAARHAPGCRLHLDDAHGRLLRQARLDAQPLRQVHLVAGDAEARAAHAAVLQHLGQHVLRRVGGDREADALRAHDDGGVDADHLAARVDQRPAGVAGVERGIGLDHVVDQAAVLARAASGPTALTMPAVTVDSKPSGLPMAMAIWPGLIFLELPSCAAGSWSLVSALQHGDIGVGIAAQQRAAERAGDR